MQVWGFALAKNDHYLISGCNDRELNIWKIYSADTQNKDINLSNIVLNDEDNDNDIVMTNFIVVIVHKL